MYGIFTSIYHKTQPKSKLRKNMEKLLYDMIIYAVYYIQMVWKLNHGKVGQCLGLAADASARDVRGVIWWDWKGPIILPWKNWTRVGQRIHTPKTNMDTKNPHSWLKGNLLWYHVISFSYFVESSQSTYQNWPFAGLSWWISRGYMNTHTHIMQIHENISK